MPAQGQLFIAKGEEAKVSLALSQTGRRQIPCKKRRGNADAHSSEGAGVSVEDTNGQNCVS